MLPEPILDVFEKGGQAPLPLIIGNNSDDSSVLADFGFSPSDVVQLLHDAGKYQAVKLLYPLGICDDELGRQVGRDLLFNTMSYVIADDHRQKAPSWRYYFDYVAQQIRPNFPNGARHGDEVSYVLDTGAIAPPTAGYFTEQDEAFARCVSDYWLAFARLAPGSHGPINIRVTPGILYPPWPKHATPVGQTMLFGKDSGNEIKLESAFLSHRVTAFKDLLKNLGNLLPGKGERIHSFQRGSRV